MIKALLKQKNQEIYNWEKTIKQASKTKAKSQLKLFFCTNNKDHFDLPRILSNLAKNHSQTFFNKDFRDKNSNVKKSQLNNSSAGNIKPLEKD